MKRCKEPRSFIVKTENDKTFRRNCQHLHQIADSNGTDNTILISKRFNRQVIVKPEEAEMDSLDEVNEPQPDNLSNEVTTQSELVSKRPIWYNDYVY